MQPDLDHCIVDNLVTAVILLDDDLQIRYLNPAAEALLGVSARAAHGTGFHALLPYDETIYACMRKALDTAQTYAEREVTLRLQRDQEITIDCIVTPLRETSEQRGLLAELVRVGRHLKFGREAGLAQIEEATRTLFRGLAHEIKNPLGGLRGAAQLLERELPSAELREYTRIIIDEADRLQALVNRMLGPSGTPKPRALNIHEILERVRTLCLAEAPPGVKIRRDYDPSLPTVFGDGDLLIQALLNIVRNAVEAVRDAGTVTLRTRAQRQFTIGTRRHRLVARIDVVDDGPGVPDELKGRLFYPMVSGQASGSGLGLSIAQSLINHHGGLIEYESRPGRTVFTLYLPLGKDDA
jgi:two-component system nitrogen regulation sensor histidine kinase GlnL